MNATIEFPIIIFIFFKSDIDDSIENNRARKIPFRIDGAVRLIFFIWLLL